MRAVSHDPTRIKEWMLFHFFLLKMRMFFLSMELSHLNCNSYKTSIFRKIFKLLLYQQETIHMPQKKILSKKVLAIESKRL